MPSILCQPEAVEVLPNGWTRWKCSLCGFSDTDKVGHFPNRIYRNCPTQHIEPIAEEQRPPGWLQRATNFSVALARHAADGFAECSQEEIDQRFAVCKTCRLFNGEICTHIRCGCGVGKEKKFLNKLSWRSESCPIGKWPAISVSAETAAKSQ